MSSPKKADKVNIIEKDNSDKESSIQAEEIDLSQVNVKNYVSPLGNTFPHDEEFTHVVSEAELTIASGIFPQLSEKGSSGSYFASNRTGVS